MRVVSDLIGGETFGLGYNGRNRLSLVQHNGATVSTYTYNALGQRIEKVAIFPQAVTEGYAYDEASQLIGEYGTTNRDYVWLGGMPVAVIDNTTSGSVTTSTVNYVTADQLGTPRAVTDGTGTVVWQWAYQGNAFGEQQPTSATGYVFNLRYPGQYFDAESGTNYNVFRTYEATTGRYLQSDPMGQAAGPSLYVYVGNNSLSYVDPLGLINPYQPSPVTALEEAILEGNVEQVEMLAEAAGAPEDTALARAAANANKIHHIFDKAEHNLEPLVNACKSRGQALKLLEDAGAKGFPDVGNGVVQDVPVEINGVKAVVRGILVNGKFIISTAFIP